MLDLKCGRNTSQGLTDYGSGILAVMLDNHGPNIAFSSQTDPNRLIDFIEENFILSDKTGGRLDLLDEAKWLQ